MLFRLGLLSLTAMLFTLSPYTLAAEKKTGVTTEEKGESIVKRHDFATAMGFSDADVSFGEPRNFRSHGTQEVQLEPMAAELEDAAPTEFPGG